MIDALAAVENAEDVVAIKSVITALYRPWLENAATAMQKVVNAGHPSQAYHIEPLSEPENGTCILFCDGLRYDVGRRLASALEANQLICKIEFSPCTPTRCYSNRKTRYISCGKTIVRKSKSRTGTRSYSEWFKGNCGGIA